MIKTIRSYIIAYLFLAVFSGFFAWYCNYPIVKGILVYTIGYIVMLIYMAGIHALSKKSEKITGNLYHFLQYYGLFLFIGFTQAIITKTSLLMVFVIYTLMALLLFFISKAGKKKNQDT